MEIELFAQARIDEAVSIPQALFFGVADHQRVDLGPVSIVSASYAPLTWAIRAIAGGVVVFGPAETTAATPQRVAA